MLVLPKALPERLQYCNSSTLVFNKPMKNILKHSKSMKIQRIQCMEETLHHLIKNLSTGVLRWTTINNVTKLSADDVPRLTMSELVVD